MKSASLVLDSNFEIGIVDKRLFGSFVEHMGRCVYGGIFEPHHPSADALGFREDVKKLVRELGPTIIRYPGGNFVSGYNWKDGIGPREIRKRKLSLAWAATESNEVGTDEFCHWAQQVGAEPLLTVNLGTGTPIEASELVEYCNHTSATYWSDLRIKNGYTAPHKVRSWCLGNEMDGPWQIGQKTANEYAIIAREAAKLMKMVDPTIELVACGSSSPNMPNYPSWEAVVLEECYDFIEYISMHTYYDNPGGTPEDLLSRSVIMEQYIREVTATCDYVAAKKRRKRKINLSFDEWNVWFSRKDTVASPLFAEKRWLESPSLVEGKSNLLDALLVGMTLINLIRNADRVKIACLSELVNVLGPIMTEVNGRAWCNSIYYPFLQAAKWASGGCSLQPIMHAPCHSTKYADDVPITEAAAVLHENGQLVLFLVNRDLKEEVNLTVKMNGFGPFRCVRKEVLTNNDYLVTNDAQESPLVPRLIIDKSFCSDVSTFVLQPLSWNVVVLESLNNLDTEQICYAGTS